MGFPVISCAMVVVALASGADAAASKHELIKNDADGATLLRREVSPHASGQEAISDAEVASANASDQDPHADERAQSHKMHEKIAREAQWAERLERHEANGKGSVPASAHET